KKPYGGLRKAGAREINHSEHSDSQRNNAVLSVPSVVKKPYGGLRKAGAREINHSEHSDSQRKNAVLSVPSVVKKPYGGLRKAGTRDINHSENTVSCLRSLCPKGHEAHEEPLSPRRFSVPSNAIKGGSLN
ncbi:MAG TPA: hypothetical protein VFO70_05265, partial [Chitinophagaceae bacterium]|nr:hypothetical protein [Chitinophagaceae bacterium]